MHQNKFRRTFIVGCGCTAFIKVRSSTPPAVGVASFDMQPRGQRTTEDVSYIPTEIH